MPSADRTHSRHRHVPFLVGILAGAALAMAALALAKPARADEPVQVAIQAVQGERRAAIRALRQGDLERARAMVHRLETRWHLEIAAVPLVRRAVEPGLSDALRQFDASIATAAALIALDDGEGAIEQLQRLSSTFDLWRSARPMPLLADCVDEFTRSWERLELARDRMAESDAGALADQAAWARAVLSRCTALARGNDAEFRSLSARLDVSLERLEQALRRGDTAAAGRLIGEQYGLERAIAYAF
jgi:hypothetical protein